MTPYLGDRAHAREQHLAETAAREEASAKLHYGPVPDAGEKQAGDTWWMVERWLNKEIDSAGS